MVRQIQMSTGRDRNIYNERLVARAKCLKF